ncbi:MAG: hypothetical protein LBV51_03400 [Acholeplasmatales bacterium]|jgi:hypothetical protein|nr:hypothetical protein [Acholeplasmatales bacterium]
MKKLYLKDLKFILDNYPKGIEIISNNDEAYFKIARSNKILATGSSYHTVFDGNSYFATSAEDSSTDIAVKTFKTYDSLLKYLTSKNIIIDDYVNVEEYGENYETLEELLHEIKLRTIPLEQFLDEVKDFEFISLECIVNFGVDKTHPNGKYKLPARELESLRDYAIYYVEQSSMAFYSRKKDELHLPSLDKIMDMIKDNYLESLERVPYHFLRDYSVLEGNTLKLDNVTLCRFMEYAYEIKKINIFFDSISKNQKVLQNERELNKVEFKDLKESLFSIDYEFKDLNGSLDLTIIKTLYFKFDDNAKKFLLSLKDEYSTTGLENISFYKHYVKRWVCSNKAKARLFISGRSAIDKGLRKACKGEIDEEIAKEMLEKMGKYL